MSNKDDKRFPIIDAFFVGGAGDEVTASNTVLKICTSDGKIRYIMIDAGAAQGEDEQKNQEYPILGEKIDAIVLTHSHYDHVGDLALLYNRGFRGKVYSTNIARELIRTMLNDGAAIAERKKMLAKQDEKTVTKLRKHLEKKKLDSLVPRDRRQLDAALEQISSYDLEPLYTFEDVEGVMELFEDTVLYEEFEILEGIFLKFIPTTHQNGAIKVEVIVRDPNEQSYIMMFSGDIGPAKSFMYEKKCKIENEHVDCAVMESLHGIAEPEETLEVSIRRLYEIVKKGIRQKKHIILVGFSLDRNAMLVKLMNDFKQRGLKFDLQIDSPLTMVQLGHYQHAYADGSAWFKDMGKDPFDIKTANVLGPYRQHTESVLNGEAPRVVITASANGNGGRVIDYFNYGIQRDDYVFVFCGWINPLSPSNILHEAEKGELVELPDATLIKRCKTYRLHGFTSHGYFDDFKEELTEYSGLETIVLNHAKVTEKLDIRDKLLEEFDGAICIPKVYQAFEFSKGCAKKLSPHECQFEFDEIFNMMSFPALADETELSRGEIVPEEVAFVAKNFG